MSNHRIVTPELDPKGRHELVLNLGHGHVTFDDHDHLIRTLSQILHRAHTIHHQRAVAEQAAKNEAGRAK